MPSTLKLRSNPFSGDLDDYLRCVEQLNETLEDNEALKRRILLLQEKLTTLEVHLADRQDRVNELGRERDRWKATAERFRRRVEFKPKRHGPSITIKPKQEKGQP